MEATVLAIDIQQEEKPAAVPDPSSLSSFISPNHRHSIFAVTAVPAASSTSTRSYRYPVPSVYRSLAVEPFLTNSRKPIYRLRCSWICIIPSIALFILVSLALLYGLKATEPVAPQRLPQVCLHSGTGLQGC